MPKISVIIPSFNEEKYIINTFAGLKTQSFKNFETIVVDKNSSDRTREISRKYARVINYKKPGIGIARNVGARAAKGSILVFLDADTKPSKDLLKIYSKAFDGKVVAATGPILALEEGDFFTNAGIKLFTGSFVKATIAVGSPTIMGMNFAVSKKAFFDAGGFDPKMITYEDIDLTNRLKKLGRIKYFDKAVVYTSLRRVRAWGLKKFFLYHVGNTVRYSLYKKPKKDYRPVR